MHKALAEFRAGKMLVVVDNKHRENEGDLICAAEKMTARKVNFMATHGRGLICVPLEKHRAGQLQLSEMAGNRDELHNCTFTVSVDLRRGVTTGISAYDRAKTIRALAAPTSKPGDFRRPGHVFPLIAVDGGVLSRPGHTEAAVDLARLAGLIPVAVICEIMNGNGRMMRLPELKRFGKRHGIRLITIRELIDYRRKAENHIRRETEARLPTRLGTFRIITYCSSVENKDAVALVKGDVRSKRDVLVRIHSECLTGDAFLSERCDCGYQLHIAMKMIEQEGRGIVIYMRQEGRGIGLLNKLRAYALQDRGFDTVEANEQLGFAPDLREYGTAASILHELGVNSVRLMTNNPEKIDALKKHGIAVTRRIPLIPPKSRHNVHYLLTKKEKMRHML